MIALLIKMILPLLLSLNIAAEIPLSRDMDNIRPMTFEGKQHLVHNTENLNSPYTIPMREIPDEADQGEYPSKSDMANFLSSLFEGRQSSVRGLKQHNSAWVYPRPEVKSSEEHRNKGEKRGSELFQEGSWRGRRSVKTRL